MQPHFALLTAIGALAVAAPSSFAQSARRDTVPRQTDADAYTRYELLAPASVAVALRIPIAHIEGGEVSEGAIDDAIRNALTKLAHVHLTPTETARR